MREVIQTCIARTVNRKSPAEEGCNVYACDEPASIVLLVGGGMDGSTSSTLVRLCRKHGEEMEAAIHRTLMIVAVEARRN